MDPILIEIPQKKTGFESFFGSWFYRGKYNILVDTGTANSATSLLAALSNMNVQRIDYILITHIHLDHAGGLADLLDCFPEALAICHSKGIEHLVDPSRLWEGTRSILGETAEMYGRLQPIKKERLLPHDEPPPGGLTILETPGHAPHHLSYVYEGNLFVGEAAGIYLQVDEMEYLRPATPPRFFPEAFQNSIDRLLSFPDMPIFYAHFARGRSSRQLLKRAVEQLKRWEDVIEEEITANSGNTVERSRKRLLQTDPELKAYFSMSPESQQREILFTSQSIKGLIGSLR